MGIVSLANPNPRPEKTSLDESKPKVIFPGRLSSLLIESIISLEG